jgi:hypothetical protein
MDPPQWREDHFQGNTIPAVDAPWNATAFPAPQPPQAAHSSHPLPVPGQPHGHAGIVRDTVFPPGNAAGNHRPVQDWEDMPPPVENFAGQRQLQDLQYVDMDHYDMGNGDPHAPLHEHRGHAIDNYAGFALDVPARAQAALPVPVCTDLTYSHTHI